MLEKKPETRSGFSPWSLCLNMSFILFFLVYLTDILVRRKENYYLQILTLNDKSTKMFSGGLELSKIRRLMRSRLSLDQNITVQFCACGKWQNYCIELKCK